MSTKVGIVGSGVVGQTLANGFIRHGDEVMLGTNTPDKRDELAARAIEPLCILWCIPGFLTNSWSHACKLLKK